MSNLNNNTQQLEALLQKVNALPEAGGTDTSDATASASEIFAGETAYTADGKVTGTFTIESELTIQNDLISQISTLVAQKATPSGGIDTSDATATEGDILSGKTAYVDGEKITGTITTKTASNLSVSGATVTVPAGYYASQATKSVSTATQATPSVSINSSGLITASATQMAGYVSAGTKSGTKQLTTQGAKTVTPTTSNQIAVASGVYTTGNITIAGDANLKAENIANGVSIFGIAGTHSGAEDLDTELTEQESLISQLSTILDNKASGGSGGSEVKICEVTFQCNDDMVYETLGGSVGGIITYQTYTDGAFSVLQEEYNFARGGKTSIVFSNVVCNSSFIIYDYLGMCLLVDSDGDYPFSINNNDVSMFIVPTSSANSNYTISIIYEE